MTDGNIHTKKQDSLSIRLLQESDLSAVLEIIRDSPTAPQWNEVQFRELLRGTPDDSVALVRMCWVMEAASGLVGVAVASALKVVYPAEAELESIAVTPAVRGRGMGRALIAVVCSWAGENGADEIRLEVRPSNVGALALYRAAGFHQTGLRRGYYANPPEDAICMAYTIPQMSADGASGR